MCGQKIGLEQSHRLLEITRDLTSSISQTTLLHRIVKAAADLTYAAAARILLLDEASGELRFVAVTGRPGQFFDLPVPIDNSIAGLAFSTGRPVIVPDVRAEPRYYPDVSRVSGSEAHSLLVVPLQYQGRGIGVLQVQDKCDDAPFGPEDVDTLSVLAAQAAISIETARLVETLRGHRDHLEELVADRTAELQQVNAQLEQEVAELDAFAHTVAHDLKGPLAIILASAELLGDQAATMGPSEIQTVSHMAASNAWRAAEIIDALLLLARARKASAVVEPLNMPRLVDEAQQRLSSQIADCRAEIVRRDSPPWPFALGYGPWIVEVWVNYLSNAIKYGGRPLRVELGACPEPDDQVRFWVRDNGPGLSPEQQARLFTPFERLGETQIEGYGLGLSISKRIIEKLGGRVGIDSRPGHGSVFYFTLPAADGAADR